MIKILVIGLLQLILVTVGYAENFDAAAAINDAYSKTNSNIDEFSKRRTVTGCYGKSFKDLEHCLIYLEIPNGEKGFAIKAEVSSDKILQLSECWSSEGVNLKCDRLPTDYDSGRFVEGVVFRVSDDDMAHYEHFGIRFKVSGVKGSQIFEIKPETFMGFLKRFREFKTAPH